VREQNLPLTRREFLAGAALMSMGAGSGDSLLSDEKCNAVLILSPIACGRLLRIDSGVAQALPEVLAVVRTGRDDQIHYLGEPLGVLVAKSAAAAEQAARSCSVFYESRPAVLTTSAALTDAHVPSPAAAPWPFSDAIALTYERGNPDAELQQATGGFILLQTYRTAPESPDSATPLLRKVLDELTARAEKAAGQPGGVRLALSPRQTEVLSGHRPETIQTLSLAAGHDGRLRALIHSSLNETAMTDEYVEPCGAVSRQLYQIDNLRVTHKVVRKNIAPATALAAAGLLPGLFALESALDELAYLIKFDPVRLRLLNHAEVDAVTGQTWESGKQLRECYRLGMERIGWNGEGGAPGWVHEPRSQHEGKFLRGLGMASTMGWRQPLQQGSANPGFGAHFVKVLCDPRTGSVWIARHIVALDVGAVPSLEQAESWAREGISLGHARALLTSQKGEKRPASETSEPKPPAEIEVIFVQPEPESQAKSAVPACRAAVRELALAGTAAAVANAIHHATGIRYRELPIVIG
jgi:CO/xanthine dehydrogenase Mo-binding subunit